MTPWRAGAPSPPPKICNRQNRDVTRLTTRAVNSPEDVVRYFDALAPTYAEAHGPVRRLLPYRLGVIRRVLLGAPCDTLREIVCGTAIALRALADGLHHAMRTDVS